MFWNNNIPDDPIKSARFEWHAIAHVTLYKISLHLPVYSDIYSKNQS